MTARAATITRDRESGHNGLVLLTITSTRTPATDLGFALHKNPARAQSFDLASGVAHVFYPEATTQTCTAALLLEVDPITLVRGRGRRPAEGFALGQYVNDRPYAASSLLAVAISRVFRTAMTGRCDARPELASTALPLRLGVPAMSARGGAQLVERLFGPLGWRVEAAPVPLDPAFPEWGDSPYVDVRLTGKVRLADALHHLYVLLPVLDDAKHYWVGSAEVDKLIRSGAGWLEAHPERDLITRRYLAHQRSLTGDAIARLAESDDLVPEPLDDAVPAFAADEVGCGAPAVESPEPPEPREPLGKARRDAVLAAIRASGARRVGDLGCGEGALVAALLAEPAVEEVVAVDVSARALASAARRLQLDGMPERRRARLRIFQSSLVYRDQRLAGLDAAVLMEVIEHVDPTRLAALERCVFGAAAPATVIVTTPNAEHNVSYGGLAPGQLRHRDHRFEWTRAQFHRWADEIAARYGYVVSFAPVGPDDPTVGPPTQLGVFTKIAAGGKSQ